MDEDVKNSWGRQCDNWIEKNGACVARYENQIEPLYPINHRIIVDGFSELAKHDYYLPFKTFCGICGATCRLSSKEQKYILEAHGVPVKMLCRGAAFCTHCRQRRIRIKSLRQHHLDKEGSAGKVRLKELIAEEDELRSQAGRLDLEGDWPY